MKPATTEEEFIAKVLADALRGELKVGFGDAARIAMSAQRIDSARIAPLALAKWMATDPHARDVVRWALQQAVRERD